eukprot:CAMPEP_0204592044 /NCGR_PEP_ID=MMETSP0661-20131031/50712_1 /ASSEMBLY_ACC=CAM_ASM_000606 /TAXON_ID=109239 /ORGANISM="Alexandrium margalefi, Strain AMGDE01CS-322" /LENGTH=280 /DNA_ID=CAMNT_0051602221 /DNA_START=68 /DNA_END=910 /DNA_ORIENTATION=-
MSFRDLDNGPKGGGHASKQQPKQRRDEDSSFERSIKANIQEMQDSVRRASELLEQAQRSVLSKRSGESLDNILEQSRAVSQETEQIFRDWTVHMAGEPTERHRRKFSYEKLRRAFEQEASHLKDLGRRAAVAQQDAALVYGSSAAARGEGSLGASEDEEAQCGLLDDSESTQQALRLAGYREDTTIWGRMAQERHDGIRRIQSQVCEVNQIIRDLASMVQDQGADIDSIESQAESSASNTKQAVLELRKAMDRHNVSREKLCCMLTAAVIVLCFVVLPHM